MTFLRNIETANNDEYSDETVHLNFGQYQKLLKGGVYIMNPDGKVSGRLRKDDLENNFDRMDAADAINDARSQLQFLRATLTQAENGLDLTPETLAGFGHILEDISDKLKPHHFGCDN